MFERGRAYKLHIPQKIRRQAAIEGGYILPATEKGVVLCEIPKGQCPYEGEGERVRYPASSTGEVCICNLDGLVEKAGLLDDKKNSEREAKIDRSKFRPF